MAAAILLGPQLGNPTATSVDVWCKLDTSGGKFKFEVALYGEPYPGIEFLSDPADPNFGDTCRAYATGLNSNSRYNYRVKREDDTVEDSGDFTTLLAPTAKGKVNLFFFSDGHENGNTMISPGEGDINRCMNVGNNLLNILDLRDLEPDVPAIAFSYGDMFANINTTNRTDFIEACHNQRVKLYGDGATESAFHKFPKHIPWINTWDDHDCIANNLAMGSPYGPGTPYAFGIFPNPTYEFLTIWKSLWSAPWAVGNWAGLSYYIRTGNVLIVNLDNRRNKEYTPGWGTLVTLDYDDHPEFFTAKVFAEDQLNWFFGVVKQHEDCDFLILISSTSLVDNIKYHLNSGAAKRDSVGLYHKAQRNAILSFLDESTKFRDVFIITGDDHFCKVHKRDWFYDEQFNVNDPAVNYQAVQKRQLNDLNWWEFKGTVGGRSGDVVEDPADIVDFGWGDCFGVPEIFYSNWGLTYYQFKIDTDKNVPTLDVVLWERLYPTFQKDPPYSPPEIGLRNHKVVWTKRFYANPSVDDETSFVGSEELDSPVYPRDILLDDFEVPDMTKYIYYAHVNVASYYDSNRLRFHSNKGFGGDYGADLVYEFPVSQPIVLSWETHLISEDAVAMWVTLYDPDGTPVYFAQETAPYSIPTLWSHTFDLDRTGNWRLWFTKIVPTFNGSANSYIDNLRVTFAGPVTIYA